MRRPEVDRNDGCFSVPTRPGLGLKLNHEVCARAPTDRWARIVCSEEGWERRQRLGG